MRIALFIFNVLIILCILDVFKIIDISRKKFFVPYLLLMPHLPLAGYMYYEACCEGIIEYSAFFTVVLIILAIALQLYSTLRLHFHVTRHNRTGNMRINIIYAGRNLLICGLNGMYLLIIWYLLCFFVFPKNPYQSLYDALFVPGSGMVRAVVLLAAEVIYSLAFVFLFILNGCVRIFCGSGNLALGKRILILVFMWVPVVQLYLAHLLGKAARDEYLVTLERERDEAYTQEDDKCATEYPIILVHGIGFRDFDLLNYWGRIPAMLKKHGAKIYYGHQNAWGTIEDNAAAIAKSIEKAMEECGTDKVNIIGHSKGGLDSRYLISSMGYEDKIASLTTINTPHRGSEIITVLNKLSDRTYRFIANQLNKPFEAVGELEPDCYSSSKQLDPLYCERFNAENPDSDKVYYQSYMSVMKGMLSDSLLTIPYIVMRLKKCKKNDGLVSEESAIWGNFRGTLTNSRYRGISHCDIIDLKRDNIRGFDVQRTYYSIVSELKEMGY